MCVGKTVLSAGLVDEPLRRPMCVGKTKEDDNFATKTERRPMCVGVCGKDPCEHDLFPTTTGSRFDDRRLA